MATMYRDNELLGNWLRYFPAHVNAHGSDGAQHVRCGVMLGTGEVASVVPLFDQNGVVGGVSVVDSNGVAFAEAYDGVTDTNLYGVLYAVIRALRKLHMLPKSIYFAQARADSRIVARAFQCGTVRGSTQPVYSPGFFTLHNDKPGLVVAGWHVVYSEDGSFKFKLAIREDNAKL